MEQFDFFISYTGKDSDWAQWIVRYGRRPVRREYPGDHVGLEKAYPSPQWDGCAREHGHTSQAGHVSSRAAISAVTILLRSLISQ
jgi:hypothetical protein